MLLEGGGVKFLGSGESRRRRGAMPPRLFIYLAAPAKEPPPRPLRAGVPPCLRPSLERPADSEGARGGRVRGGSGSRPELPGSMTNTSSFHTEKTVGDRQGDAPSSTSNRTWLPSATPDLSLSLCLSLCLLLMEMTRSLTGDCLIPCPPNPHVRANNPAQAIIHAVIRINTFSANAVRLAFTASLLHL